jgi:hypothetical protein
MQAWEKHLIQPAFNAFLGARMGAIERKWPGFPAKPDHGAPFVCYRVLFGREHANFLHSNDGVHQREFWPNQRTLSEVTLPMRFVTSKKSLAETIDPRNESLTGLERCN